LAADIGAAMGSLALIGLILLFMAKLINVLKAGSFYEAYMIFITWVGSAIALFFVMVGLLTEKSVIMGSYMIFASVVFSMITILFIIELILSFGRTDFRGRIQTAFMKQK